MKPEGFIFDLDGTLADTLPLCIFSFQESMENVCGIRPTKEEVMSYFGYTEEAITKNLLPDDWSSYYETYLEVYKSNHHMCPKPFEGIVEILDHLWENSYKLALVTGKGKDSAEITLDKYDLKKYFEHIETGSSKGSIKPECIKRILDKWAIEAHKVFYVGDTHTDILDSKEVGVLPIAVSWASTSDHQKLLEYDPHLIFSKIDDFKKWLMS